MLKRKSSAPAAVALPSDEQQRAPLMRSVSTGAITWTVTCYGVEASLSVQDDGGVTYTPRSASLRRACGRCCGKEEASPQQLDGEVVIGAALEGPATLRVWYVALSRARGAAAVPHARLRLADRGG